MWSPKSIAMIAITLVVSTSAIAHDPKLHSKKDQMSCEKIQKHMQVMKKMDHSKMDMNDPAMKAMMANMGKMKKIYQQHCVASGSKS